MHIADREADDIVDSPVKAGSINPFDEEEELESFLDEVYRGAGRFAKDFMGAGVTSPESFAEAALVDPQAIDELVDIVKVHASDMSPYLVIMLKKALKRRFATTTMPTRRP